jgi:adenylosuccinate synthase
MAMTGVIVVGMQWGDEGKGKVVDLLTDQVNAIVRAQGGNNAGHTVIIGDEEYKLHLIPSGVLRENTQCFIGAGTVIDPEVLLREMKGLEARGIRLADRLWISQHAHIIFPYHKQLDLLYESTKGARAIGTTGRGIGPCYADKANRIGIRMEEFIRPEVFRRTLTSVVEMKNLELTKLYEEAPIDIEALYCEYSALADQLRPFVTDVEAEVHRLLDTEVPVLFEGAQGTFLDLTSGTYPFVTSSNTVAAGICVGAGIGPRHIGHTLGVIKAYTTRVGNGPLPSQADFIDPDKHRERGTTTGRARRAGWFDAVLAKEAVQLNGADSLAVTKLDILDDLSRIQICVGYLLDGKQLNRLPALTEDLERVVPIYEEMEGWCSSTKELTDPDQLPENARRYLQRLEELCGVPISLVSVGPARAQTLVIRSIVGNRELATV